MQETLVEQCAVRFSGTDKRIEIPVAIPRQPRLEKHALIAHLPRVKKALFAQATSIWAKENFQRKLRQTPQGIALGKERIGRASEFNCLAVWAINHARRSHCTQRQFAHALEAIQLPVCVIQRTLLAEDI